MDTAKEPVFFHAGPIQLQEEIIHDFSVGAVNDLSAGSVTKLAFAIMFFNES